MKLLVLGSSAGGGFPQWNCNCPNCHGVRHGSIKATPRTQSSIAITENDKDWLLINASPDILTQLRRHPELQPERAIRDSGISGVLLMDAQIDHVTGLLMLREYQTHLPLYATDAVQEDLRTGFPLINILSHYCGTKIHTLALHQTGLQLPWLHNATIQCIPVISKAPPYSPHREQPQPGDNIALLIRNLDTGRAVFYAPGLEQIDHALLNIMAQADILLIDGTFWHDDEMIRPGLSKKSARSMGHLPLSGDDGLIEKTRTLAQKRRILIHINNSNPILQEDSSEARQLETERIEVARDGMVINF